MLYFLYLSANLSLYLSLSLSLSVSVVFVYASFLFNQFLFFSSIPSLLILYFLFSIYFPKSSLLYLGRIRFSFYLLLSHSLSFSSSVRRPFSLSLSLSLSLSIYLSIYLSISVTLLSVFRIFSLHSSPF